MGLVADLGFGLWQSSSRLTFPSTILHHSSSSLVRIHLPTSPLVSAIPSSSDSAADPVVSGTTARGRRLLKVREEKTKRDWDRLHKYPSWAKILEDACEHDEEIRDILGDSIGNPELMRKRMEDNIRRKGRDFRKSKTGSILAFKVSFRDFNPIDSYIWFEFVGSPSDRDVALFGGVSPFFPPLSLSFWSLFIHYWSYVYFPPTKSNYLHLPKPIMQVIQSWYVMGRLGSFNSSNLQLGSSLMEYDPLYDSEKASQVMPSSFHDIGDVEFQDNWARIWVDLGTSDFFAIDVLLNCLTVLSAEHLGIRQVVFGGRKLGDWEEGMTNPEYGYKSFKI
ncbi:hypothetical protein LINPERPRIM_LOCUS39007 [Linum perenne]